MSSVFDEWKSSPPDSSQHQKQTVTWSASGEEYELVVAEDGEVTPSALYLLDQKLIDPDTCYDLPDSYGKEGSEKLDRKGLLEEGQIESHVPVLDILERVEENDTPKELDELESDARELIAEEGEIGYWEFVRRFPDEILEEKDYSESGYLLERAGKVIESIDDLRYGDAGDEVFRSG